MKALKIKDWAQEDRPREKLLLHGASVLSDAELIAILIGSGTRNETAVDIAKRLLAESQNNLGALGQKSITDFLKIKGIGSARAVTIAAALELGRRRRNNEHKELTKIATSSDIFELFRPLLSDLPHEEFWIVLLNNSGKLIAKHKISQGGTNKTLVDIKIVAKLAVENLAASAAIVHNHPSGNTNPSGEDENLTIKIKSALNLLDIKLIDHIIIAANAYYSFADQGKI